MEQMRIFLSSVVDEDRQIASQNRKNDLQVVELFFGCQSACQIQEQRVEVFRLIRQQRVSERVVEQFVALPQIQEHAVAVVNLTQTIGFVRC